MKNEVSSLELRHLVAELGTLVGARIEKIYQPHARTFLFAVRKVGEEKRLLRIDLPKFLYLTAAKEDMPSKLTGFCGFLRKYLEGTVITGIEQLNLERIVRITCAAKEDSFRLYLELFGKGNLIVCEEDNSIRSCLEQAVFKDRVVKPGSFYEVPERETFDKLDLNRFSDILAASKHENVSTALAVDLGLGGLLANELCLLSGVAPGTKASASDTEKLFAALQSTLKRKPAPLLVLRKDKPEEIILFPMRTFEKDTLVPLKSLSEGLDRLFIHAVQQTPKPQKDKQLEKLRTIVAMQEQNAVKLEKQTEEEQKKGEFIYEHYQEVKKLLDELQSLMQKHSLQEIQAKLKGHKVVKDVNPKDGTVVLEF